jgi:hypothetical protein
MVRAEPFTGIRPCGLATIAKDLTEMPDPVFKIESHSKAQISLRHLIEEHIYTFDVSEGPKGKELMLSNIRAGQKGEHEADMLVGDAALFAISQAKSRGLIK